MFDLPIYFPKGLAGKSTARRRLELGARDKLEKDMRAEGYRLIKGTFKTQWETPCQGKASAAGYLVRGGINGKPA